MNSSAPEVAEVPTGVMTVRSMVPAVPVGEPERVTQMRAVLPTLAAGLTGIKPLRGCPSGAVQRPCDQTRICGPEGR